jgi:hypothetical protein
LDERRLTHDVLARVEAALALVLIRVGSTSSREVVAGASGAPTIVVLIVMLLTGAPIRVALSAMKLTGGRRQLMIIVLLVPRAPTRGSELPRVSMEAGKCTLRRNGDLDGTRAVGDRAGEVNLLKMDSAVTKRV